jgi:hypothetical protein
MGKFKAKFETVLTEKSEHWIFSFDDKSRGEKSSDTVSFEKEDNHPGIVSWAGHYSIRPVQSGPKICPSVKIKCFRLQGL